MVLSQRVEMMGRVRVKITEEGMNHLRLGLTMGYLISKKGDSVYILVDNKKTIEKYNRKFWQAYYVDEGHLY